MRVMITRSNRRLAPVAVAIALLGGAGAAQSTGLSERDRAEIQHLSEQYLRALNACAAEEYAALFAPGSYFESTFRGRIEGRDKLIELVRSERHCAPGAAPRQGGAPPRVAIEAAGEGAKGFAMLGNDVGAYDDRYVRTPQGWRFASRTVLTPKELAARGGSAK